MNSSNILSHNSHNDNISDHVDNRVIRPKYCSIHASLGCRIVPRSWEFALQCRDEERRDAPDADDGFARDNDPFLAAAAHHAETHGAGELGEEERGDEHDVGGILSLNGRS